MKIFRTAENSNLIYLIFLLYKAVCKISEKGKPSRYRVTKNCQYGVATGKHAAFRHE